MKRTILFVVSLGLFLGCGFLAKTCLDTYYQCSEMYKLFQIAKAKIDPKVLVANLVTVGIVAQDVDKLKRDMNVAKHVIIDSKLGLEKLREDFEHNEAEANAQEVRMRVIAQDAQRCASHAESVALDVSREVLRIANKIEDLDKNVQLALSQVQKNNLELRRDVLSLDSRNIFNIMEHKRYEIEDFQGALASLQALGRDRRYFSKEIVIYKDHIDSQLKFLEYFNDSYLSNIKQINDLDGKLNQ